jgi:hypothetical protein
MKIYFNEEQKKLLSEVMEIGDRPITYHGFLTHVKKFLKELLTDPINAKVDNYLLTYGIYKPKLLQKLLKRNVIVKEEKIIEKEGEKPVFSIKYKVLRMDFEKKLRRMFAELCEVNLPEKQNVEKNIEECDSGGMGGATSASAVNATAPITPMGQPMRRTIYLTKEQAIHAMRECSKSKKPVIKEDEDDSWMNPIDKTMFGKYLRDLDNYMATSGGSQFQKRLDNDRNEFTDLIMDMLYLENVNDPKQVFSEVFKYLDNSGKLEDPTVEEYLNQMREWISTQGGGWEIEEATTTTSVGNYAYDVPFAVKTADGKTDPTMIRKKGQAMSWEKLT